MILFEQYITIKLLYICYCLILFELYTEQLKRGIFSRQTYDPGGSTYTYGRKSVEKIATQSMSKICNLWHLIVVDCDYSES